MPHTTIPKAPSPTKTESPKVRYTDVVYPYSGLFPFAANTTRAAKEKGLTVNKSIHTEKCPPQKVAYRGKTWPNRVKKEFDAEGADEENGVEGIGLFYFGARYYDAAVGCWSSCDPNEQFWSRYAYTGNGYNPVSAIDPDGKKVFAFSRPVPFSAGNNHMFIVVRKGNTYHYRGHIGGGFWGSDGEDLVMGRATFTRETMADFAEQFPDIRHLIDETITEGHVIGVPDGMPSPQFDDAVLNSAEEIWPTFIEAGYPAAWEQFNEGQEINSNSFVDWTIENAGGEIPDFQKTPLQNSRVVIVEEVDGELVEEVEEEEE